MDAVVLTPNPSFYEKREKQYQQFVSSLDSRELEVFLHAEMNGESMELFAHDMFVCGNFQIDDLAAQVLMLLGEI